MVYIDHFTKKVNLVPLRYKSAEEVSERILDIFCDSGPPHILHSDNGREFSNNLLLSTLGEKWPPLKVVHGKPQHPESQGAVERANRYIKDALFGMMYDHDSDQCWIKYLRWVQWDHNTSYHTVIRMTPYEAVYNRKPSCWLANIGIPHEFWNDINTEDDIETFQRNIVEPGLDVVREEQQVFDHVAEPEIVSSSSFSPSPIPTCTTQFDEYENEIVTPIPIGMIVSEHKVPYSQQQPSIDSPIPSFNQGYQVLEEVLPGLSKFPHVPPPVNASESVTSIVDRSCVVCGEETSGGHSCPRCFGNNHIICGRPEGEEGYGGIVCVVCPPCDLSSRRDACEEMRARIKKNQERKHERMLNASSKKFKQAQVGDSVLIPISQPDKISSLGPRNILGCISSRDDSTYSIGRSQGTLAVSYSRNQFEVCPTNLLSVDSIPVVTITQTKAMQSVSLGVADCSACKCKNCKTQRCACRKAGRSCNTKCHKGHSCFNKYS